MRGAGAPPARSTTRLTHHRRCFNGCRRVACATKPTAPCHCVAQAPRLREAPRVLITTAGASTAAGESPAPQNPLRLALAWRRRPACEKHHASYSPPPVLQQLQASRLRYKTRCALPLRGAGAPPARSTTHLTHHRRRFNGCRRVACATKPAAPCQCVAQAPRLREAPRVLLATAGASTAAGESLAPQNLLRQRRFE